MESHRTFGSRTRSLFLQLLLSLGVLLLSCSREAGESGVTDDNEHITDAVYEEIIELPPVPLVPRFALSVERARPGEPVVVAYSDDFAGFEGNLYATLLNAQGIRLSRAVFFDLPSENIETEGYELPVKAAILAVPNQAAFGDRIIRIQYGDEVIRELSFLIESRVFNSQTIQLNRANTEIRTAPNPERITQSEQMSAIIARTGTEIYDTGPFTPPLNSTRRTSHFGDRRVYQYEGGGTDTTIHAGIDFGVPTGTPVRASGRGRVVLAQNRIVTGYTVVLEHMPGVYSLYYHLDSIAVSTGDIVERGELLGESGSTGLSTGPHLHWEFRVSTEFADPDAFLTHPVLDKEEIINKLITENKTLTDKGGD